MDTFLLLYFTVFLNGTGYSGREHGVHSEDVHGISQHSKNAKPLEDQIDIGKMHELDNRLLS